MTEIPEHLLQRSRARRAAMGMAVEGDDVPAAAPTESANAPAVADAGAAAMKAPVPIPAAEPPPPEPPKSEWVATAENRRKIPYWVMPVLLFLPVWLFMYVGTLEEPTREEGILYEGSVVYEGGAGNCANCHGAGGGGGAGPAFTNGAVIDSFATPESQMAWVVHGSQTYVDAGLDVYGTADKPVLGFNGQPMPGFGASLTAEEIIAVVFYERIELGGHEDELPLAEALWDKIDHGELELPEHFVEGVDGDLLGTGEIFDAIESTRAELAEAEVAAG